MGNKNYKKTIERFLYLIRQKLSKRNILEALLALLFMTIFALLFDWLILNLITRCCEGGICIPDIYPQCRNQKYNGGDND